MTADNRRPVTAIDTIMDRHLDDHAALDPIMATTLGIAGHDTELPDLSPDALAEISALRRRTLAALSEAQPEDAVDRVTAAAARDQLGIAEAIRATGAEESRLNNIESPVQTIRQVFDLMPTATADDWAAVASRLRRVPDAIAGYIASLRYAAARAHVSPRRQVEAAIGQCRANTGGDGFFATLARDASPHDGSLPPALRNDVEHAAREAGDAYDRLAAFLGDELFPQAATEDAVGPERYALFARSYLGTSVDLAEAYAWGQHELSRIAAQMRATAARVKPGSSVREAMDHLTADPARRLSGVDALQAWMQDKADSAIAALGGTQFDIPEPVRVLECRIAPAGGGIYYTNPSDDFSRPGRMWWSVPPGVNEFSTWRELSTVYHEGVPGHHLQIGQTVYRREVLNRWRRLASWVSGHGEGWALYAEQLMAELGFLDDPGDYLGMLGSQAFRAARVVIDIGMHCGFDPPDQDSGPWTYDKALRLLAAHTTKTESRLRYEVDRYLGLPGQAASYKLGERVWLRLRDEVRAREGDAFDLKSFHRRALDVGGVGLDVLSAAVLGEIGD
ncbi:DUF885 family protein [Nonomuraea phyllanthi]|uniref:DUF885 domain-containing protein n=1 Tax=Nonomuraea phyllanthi TaxID=2219224 RepID=UPI001293EC70|nr:DUF885 domain-containing protein [Nonomuraea phyllanthi]QFY06705.1 DUF885 family protein [Nonomuraea phyllanthi]